MNRTSRKLLWRVYGEIPGIGIIDRKTQAYSKKQALLQTAECVKNEFFRKRGFPAPERLFFNKLHIEEIPG